MGCLRAIVELLLPLFGPYMFGPKTQVDIRMLTNVRVKLILLFGLLLFLLLSSMSSALFSTLTTVLKEYPLTSAIFLLLVL
jgi:hypothetical protein